MKYIVHDDHEFVYFVVQKVACTSVKSAIRPLFDFETPAADGGGGGDRQNGAKRGGIHKRFDRSRYQINENKLLKRMDRRYRNYFKFGFVRNPWDRIVSCYFNKFRKGGPALGLPDDEIDVELYPGMPFAEFVEAVHAIPDESSNPHFKSQHTVFCPRGDGVVLADFVGRFEDLASDFDIVTRKIGVDGEIELPHKLRNKRREGRSYAEFYDDRLRRLVHERFRDDVEIFEYSF